MNKIRFAFALLLCGIVASAQDSWSLQRCLATALENSIDVKISQLEIVRARKNYTNPALQLVPTIGLTANHSYNFGSTIDPNTNARVSSDIQYDNFFLSANVNLLDFGIFAEAGKNKIGIDLAKADKQVVEYEYKLQLLEKYFEALYSQELLKIMKQQMENTIFNRERILKEVDLGRKPKSDLYDIELAFTQEEKALLETGQLYELQKLQLFQLMNFKVEIATVVLEPYFVQNSDVSFTEQFNPKVRFAELKVKSAKKDVRLLQSENLPRLSAFYGFSTFYTYPINQPGVVVVDGFSTQIDNNKNHQAGLQLTIPVFNGFSKSRRITASKIESEKTKWAAENEKIKINQQIEVEKARRSQITQIQKKLQKTFEFAEASFRTAQSKFSSGKTEAVVFTSVKNQLLTSEYDLLKNDLQLQYISLKINLLERNEL